MKVKVQTLDAKAGGDIELDDAIFGVEPRADILHRVVTWQLDNRRGTARAARERSDVARTGKKFGSQKGGGTARHGDRRAPIFVGGGKAHGPRARDLHPSPQQEGPRARPQDGAVGEGEGRPAGRARQSRPQGRQDHGAAGAARQARLRQDRAGDRRRRAERRLRPRLVEPRAASTCCRRSAPTSTTSCATRRWS